MSNVPPPRSKTAIFSFFFVCSPYASAAAVGFDKLGQVGVLYHGLEVLGGGAILSGLVLGAIGVFIIEKKFAKEIREELEK